MERYLSKPVLEDLKEKMVFLAGPRQVGKTFFSKNLFSPSQVDYLNWDNREDRKRILKSLWKSDAEVIIFDEIHKYKKWKNFVKGIYDKHLDDRKFLVTGSARLDVYRKGGDSMQGRYHLYRMHPFTLAEALGLSLPGEKEIVPFAPLQIPKDLSKKNESISTLSDLIEFGGFPEPFLKKSQRKLRRWQNERLDRFFKEDIRDLENLPDLSGIETLCDILPSRAGSPLSINSLREDLDTSHKAISHWIDILERLYFLYRMRPFAVKKTRSLKKEPKMYLWDWAIISNPGARFENLVASHLLKFCHFYTDYAGYKMELCYLRDKEKREVDFLVLCDGKPWFTVEAKVSDTAISPQLIYFNTRLEIKESYQVVLNSDGDYKNGGIRVLPAWKFLQALI